MKLLFSSVDGSIRGEGWEPWVYMGVPLQECKVEAQVILHASRQRGKLLATIREIFYKLAEPSGIQFLAIIFIIDHSHFFDPLPNVLPSRLSHLVVE